MTSEHDQVIGKSDAGLKLAVLLVVIIVCTLLGSLINMGFLYFNDQNPVIGESLDTGTLKTSLLIMTLFTFLVPAVVFGWMYEKRLFPINLRIHQRPDLRWIGTAILMLILLMPIIQYTYELNQKIPLPSWMKLMEDSANATLLQLLQMDNFGQLIINLGLIAILPALGEELLFRGILQRLGYSIFAKPQISIWVTAIVFSAIHLQFEGFIPRFLLGLFLGYLFYWTKNLWLPIAMHFLNNAFMLLLAYGTPAEELAMDEVALPDLPILGVLAAGILLIPGVLYFGRVQKSISETS